MSSSKNPRNMANITSLSGRPEEGLLNIMLTPKQNQIYRIGKKKKADAPSAYLLFLPFLDMFSSFPPPKKKKKVFLKKDGRGALS